jgi:hypothetical protein
MEQFAARFAELLASKVADRLAAQLSLCWSFGTMRRRNSHPL